MVICKGKDKYNSSKGYSIMIFKTQWKIPLQSLKVHKENRYRMSWESGEKGGECTPDSGFMANGQ